MTQLGWELPTLTDFLIGLFLGFLPVMFLSTIVIQIFVKQIIDNRNKANKLTALLSPWIIVVVWSIFSHQSLISVTVFSFTQFIFTIVAYIIISVILFIFLLVFDKFLLLPKKILYVVIPLILLLFTFLFPKKIYKEYDGFNYYDVTVCQCIGLNTKPQNLTSQYNACLGIPVSCSTKRNYCEGDLGCPVDL